MLIIGFVSLGCIVDNEPQCEQDSRAHQREEAHHGPLGEDLAAQAGWGLAGALLGRGPLLWEAVVLDDVAVVGQRGLDDGLVLDVAVQAEAWVSLVVEGVGEVALQGHAM